MSRGRRPCLTVLIGMALIVGSCTAKVSEPVPSPVSTLSTPTSDPIGPEVEHPGSVEIVYAVGQAFNDGDRTAFDELWLADASMNGEVKFSDPEITWTVDVAMNGLHEQVIDPTCHLVEPNVVYCDELHIDDLLRPAGVGWRTSRAYEVASGRIVAYTEISSNRRTMDVFYSKFIDWIATQDPDLYERAFDFDQEIVWVSIEAVNDAVALVDEFVADSPDYPLVPPERLEQPELTGTVAGEPGAEIEVFNGEARQIEVVEWGAQRYQLAALGIPHVASVTFPPHELCARNSGWAIDDGEEQRIVLCIHEDEICEDEDCDTLSTLARATLVHEMAHVWTNNNVDLVLRERFLALRGLEIWQSPNLPWVEQGSEHAAEVIMWGVMEEPLDLFRLGIPSCGELEEAYLLLTGRPSLRGDC